MSNQATGTRKLDDLRQSARVSGLAARRGRVNPNRVLRPPAARIWQGTRPPGLSITLSDCGRSTASAHTAAAMRGNLVAQTAGLRRAELDVLRPVTPAARRPCQRFGAAGERAHSPRRAWLSPQEALPASRPGSMRRPAWPGRRHGRAGSSAAGRRRSGAAGASPPAVSLAEHRVESGVGPDRPDLLRAAAGGGDLGSPLQRVLA